MVMSTVRIAELKSRLSEYLRIVRTGRTVTILDRDTPIARIIPWQDRPETLRVRSPQSGAPRLQQVPLPRPLRMRVDVVELLLEERQGHR